MADEQEVPVESTVTAEAPSAEVQEVAQPEVEVETPEVETAPKATEVLKPQVEAVDEMGVPYKNRYMEYQRKFQKAEEEKQRLLEQQQAKQQPETPKYTTEQLRAFAASTDDSQSRIWALNELDRISKEEVKSIVGSEIQALNRQQQEAFVKQQTFNTVVSRNPDLVVKDPNGNLIGFNEKSPLFNRMNYYMSNPQISSRPEALEIAEAFAIRDLTYANKPLVAKTIEKQANQIKNLQRKTMVEGSGKNARISVSDRQAAIEKLKQTGTVKDGAQAMGAILRDSGLLSE